MPSVSPEGERPLWKVELLSSLTGTMFDHGPTPVLEEAMRFAENRHRLILSNIANADTPGYRRQDLDVNRFHKVLGSAIRDRAQRHPGAFVMGRRVEMKGYHHGSGFRAPSISPYPGVTGPLRHDENNVSLEREMALLAKNAGGYSQLAGLYAKGLRQLRAAITERPET